MMLRTARDLLVDSQFWMPIDEIEEIRDIICESWAFNAVFRKQLAGYRSVIRLRQEEVRHGRVGESRDGRREREHQHPFRQ